MDIEKNKDIGVKIDIVEKIYIDNGKKNIDSGRK